MSTLEELREQGDRQAFPAHRLDGLETALILFAAAFKGKQDACWIAEAGLTGWCIDIRPAALEAMKPLYPPDWRFIQADAYEYAPEGEMWDVVTVDCPSGHFDRSAARVDTWAAMAGDVLILGTGRLTFLKPPVGWEVVEVVKRSDYRGGVFWTVLERA